mmetsp:Transcript_8093/g.26692  ORF Transcript_8093/g.26692 Transcript_8093/m.26692 type:complete len:227 (+) Transcript_8093:764-1444(+)
MQPSAKRVTPVIAIESRKYLSGGTSLPARLVRAAAMMKPRSGMEPKAVKATNIAVPFSSGLGPLAFATPPSICASALDERYSPAPMERASASTVEMPMTRVSEVEVWREPATAASKAKVVKMPSIPPKTTPRTWSSRRSFRGTGTVGPVLPFFGLAAKSSALALCKAWPKEPPPRSRSASACDPSTGRKGAACMDAPEVAASAEMSSSNGIDDRRAARDGRGWRRP